MVTSRSGKMAKNMVDQRTVAMLEGHKDYVRGEEICKIAASIWNMRTSMAAR